MKGGGSWTGSAQGWRRQPFLLLPYQGEQLVSARDRTEHQERLRRSLSIAILMRGAGNLGPAIRMIDSIDEGQSAFLMAELHRLRTEHRDLDAAIGALEGVGPTDQLQIQRLKRRKLYLKDRIIEIEDQMTPDIIA